ncbi:MAG: NYN domain-containing protein [Parachlamydiales bacterium]|nr:NYN domain-containing protein [Verrucomicrobiota bacterium]
MRYLIDGYNLLFRIAKPGRALEKKREALIAELNQVIADFKLKATVVFDGSHPGISHAMRHHFDALEIIYTYQNLSADEYIIEEVNSARRPEEIIVITSDRGLALTCKNLGAKTQTIEAFISSLKKKTVKKKKRQKESRPETAFKDSNAEINRLLEIFEKKLNEDVS